MIRPASSFTRIVATMAVLFAVCGAALAQEAARPDRGNAVNRNYVISDIENINLQNGNVQLAIPLAALPAIAGGKLSWTVNAHYNSKLWDVLRMQIDQGDLQWAPYVVDVPGAGGGWTIGGQYVMQFRNSNDDFSRAWYSANSGLPQWELNLLNNFQWWKIVLVFPDGSEHEFRPIDAGTAYSGTQDFLRGYYNSIPSGTAKRYYSVDGTYLFASITAAQNWTVYMPDGTQIIQTPDGIQRIQDTNGNKIKIFSDANGAHYQDEHTGREIRVIYDPAANGGQGQYRVWYDTIGGVDQHIDINMGTTTVQGKTYQVNDWDMGNEMVCQRTEGLYTQLQVVREIVLPQTAPSQPRKFAFSYNSDTTESTSGIVNWSCYGGFENYTRNASVGWGELSRMIAPPGTIQTAAYSDYTYSLTSSHSLDFSTDDVANQSIIEKKLTHDGVVDTWTYGVAEGGASVVSPDGNNFSESRYCASFGVPGCSTDKAGLAYRTNRPFMRTERHWINLVFSGANVAGPGGVLSFNPVVDFEYTTLLDASNNPLKMSAKAFQYDYNGNVTQTTEYDWFDPALVSRDAVGVPTGVPASATVLRITNNSYYNQAVGSTSGNVYAKRTIPGGTPLILNAVKETTAGTSIMQLSYDGQAYGVAPTAGNLTTKNVWVDLDSKWITTSNTYGAYGNIATSTDGRGKVTQYFYDDSTHALPTRVTVDPQNGTGTQTITTVYDHYTGLATSETDVNGQISTIDYTNQLLGTVDPFSRPGITKSPVININGTNHQRRVTTTYLDSARQVIVESDFNAENDKLIKTRTTTDMLGRPVLTEQTEDGTNYTISVRNAYLDMGRVTLTSSPMRSSTTSTDSWTRFTKDNAGRVTEVATFGGAAQPAWTGTAGNYTGSVTTAYEANFTTVTDQAGKVRRSMTDAGGRLRRVDEPDGSGSLGATASPVQPTFYAYDVFDNLTGVTQGSQTRSFSYDSVSRMRTAVNPESGTVTYQYDDNGNLLVKTDARGVSIHYEYDSLNRASRRWYNGSNSTTATTHNSPALPTGVGTTDEVRFYYDTQSLPGGAPSYSRGSAIGRLVAQTYAGGSNGDYFAYDVLGRPTVKYQQTGTINFQVIATYNLAGALTGLSYPSGRTISNSYDQAGRLTAFSGNLGDGTTRTYSTGMNYSAVGGLLKEQFGTATSVYHKIHYNSRAQICDVRASNVNDEWGGELGALVNHYTTAWAHCGNGPDNNGNVLMSQTIVNSYYMEDRYTYDSLNRLTAVNNWQNGATHTGSQQYTYDRWGNRNINPASWGTGINTKQFTVNTSNNRLGVPGGQPGAMNYDAAGNLTNDTYSGVGTRTYDGESRMTVAADNTGQTSRYTYDGEGKRVRRQVASSQEMWQVYGFGGELLAEYRATVPATGPEKEYGYRSGQLLVTATGRLNVAAAANGGVATASSAHTCCGFSTTGAINGNFRGPWGNGEGWNDATDNVVPDWIQVDFAGSKTIDEINVFSLHDNYTQENNPTLTQTFSLYGLLAFDVQYWNGSSWVTIPGGSVTGNNKVWRNFTFSAITTSKIRVYINTVPDAWTRVVEIQAFGTPAGNEKVQWLVPDHLGTPRMIFDLSGSLASTKRHDYLPFGEELFAPAGGRTTAMGYSGGDGVRQQFTSKERDFETGLDYFGARYFSSIQGRFISVDQAAPDLVDPQTWNRYQYARNNPLYYIDPDGNKDEPAKKQRVNDALASDPTLLEVIKASNNFSQRAFEDALDRGDLKGRLDSSAANILRGLAGEAITIDKLRSTSGLITISQPANLSRFGHNVSLPNDVAPDIATFFINGTIRIPGAGRIEATAVLKNIVTGAGGQTTEVGLPSNVRFGLVEVKAGFSGKNIAKGASQVAAAASLLKAAKLPGVAILVVDKAAFMKLSANERAKIYKKITEAGAYLQVDEDLAAEAAKRARDVAKKAK